MSKEKMTCECGAVIQKQNLRKHRQSKKCRNNRGVITEVKIHYLLTDEYLGTATNIFNKYHLQDEIISKMIKNERLLREHIHLSVYEGTEVNVLKYDKDYIDVIQQHDKLYIAVSATEVKILCNRTKKELGTIYKSKWLGLLIYQVEKFLSELYKNERTSKVILLKLIDKQQPQHRIIWERGTANFNSNLSFCYPNDKFIDEGDIEEIYIDFVLTLPDI